MTEPADPLPPPLEYASPHEDRPSASRMVIQAIAGCALTCGLLMGAVLFGVLFTASSGTVGVAALAILLGVALLGSTIALAVGTGRNSMRRGWAMGIWIGIGLAALLEGLCFGGMMF